MMKLYLGVAVVMFCTVTALADSPQSGNHKKQDAIAEQLRDKGVLKPIEIPSASYLPNRVEIPSTAFPLPPVITPTLADPIRDIRVSTALNAADMGRDNAGRQIESLLKELYPRDVATSRILLFTLASWHEARREYLDAAHAIERWLSLPLPEADHANATVQTARDYWRAGEKQQAKVLYDRVPDYGYGWATGMAIYDQAQYLMEEGNWAAAQELLQQAIKSNAVTGPYAEQAMPGLWGALGYAQYRQNDLKGARSSVQTAQKLYAALSQILDKDGMGVQLAKAQQLESWIKRWQKNALIIEPDHLTVAVRDANGLPGKAGMVYFHFTVRSLMDVPFSVNVGDSGMQQQSPAPKPVQGTYDLARDVALQLPVKGDEQPRTLTVTVTSPAFPGFRKDVSVELVRAK